MNKKITIKNLVDRYGYDSSAIGRDWVAKGLKMGWDEQTINAWVVENIMRPLREGTLSVQIQNEKLQKLTAERKLTEIQLEKEYENVVDVSYVELVLSEFLIIIKQQIRSLPSGIYLELFACTEATEIRDVLKNKIDAVLNDIGEMEFELPEDNEVLEESEYEQQDEIDLDIEEEPTDNKTTEESESI
ncbi:hypothetical protein ACSJEN_002785 [Yersinia enterocolitica]